MLFEDFHGYSVPQVKVGLARIFRKAAENASVSIYLVTGRGNHINPNGDRGVLKRILPELLKPYSSFIEKIEEEPAAYKITLKKTLHPSGNFLDSFFSHMNESPLRELMIIDLRQTEERAKKGKIDDLVHIASIYISGFLPEFNNSQRGIDYFLDAIDLGSLEAARMLGLCYLYGTSNCQTNYGKAEKYLMMAAEKGDAEAQFQLGTFYLMGQAGYTDESKGRQWIQSAADKNNVYAIQTLADSYFIGDFTDQDIQQAVAYLERGVAAGYYRSQIGLARCYGAGQGVERNLNKAFELYNKAAVHNDIFALFQLGEYHSDDRVGKKDLTKAFSYYMRAAELGDSDAMTRVAQSYFLGSGTTKDENKGMEWLQRAVDQKNPGACFMMSGLVGKGKSKEERLKIKMKLMCDAATWGSDEALDFMAFSLLGDKIPDSEINSMIFSCLLKLAKAKNPKAQAILADAYFKGKGTSIDENEGTKWLITSVDGKSSQAYYMLAQRYRRDDRNPVRHLWMWYMRLAADEGIDDAQMEMGVALFRGDETPRDRLASHSYLLQAAEQGNVNAKSLVGHAFMNGEDNIPKDEEKGIKWLKEAADEGEVKAQYSLGIAFYNGHGVTQDKATAFSYLLKAAQQNFTPAQISVVHSYMSGDGVEKNAREGVKWLEQLAERGEPTACFLLSEIYFRAAEQQDQSLFDKAMYYLRLSAEKSFPAAQYALGDILFQKGQKNEGVQLRQLALAQGYTAGDRISFEPLPPKRSGSTAHPS